jgi:NitT/TauT family transport system permease protein
MLRPVPSVALIPLGILVFGFGAQMEVLIVAFACLWPMGTIVANAVRGIEPQLFEVARNLELPWHVRSLRIIAPVMVPHLFLGIKLTMGVALVVAVTVEIAANPQGLGYGIVTAQQGLKPDLALGLVLWIGALGMCVNALLQWMELRFFGRYLASSGRTQ